jgi:isoamylase
MAIARTLPTIGSRDWYALEGAPSPLGVVYVEAEKAYNFALYSHHATAVTLMLYRDRDPVNPVYTLDLKYPGNKTGRVWHCRIPATVVERAKYYAYRIDGPRNISEGHRFDPDKVLLDPYAHSVYFPPAHSREAARVPGKNDGKAPLGIIRNTDGDFDWGADHHPRHGSETVMYEMHVKGFTARANSGVNEASRGTYRGVIEKIPYLKELGVNVVELLPVQQFDPQEGNYWGYMTLNFFSPHHNYASDRRAGAQIREFKEMVRSLHEAGIEVILDVVYNHTTEWDEIGPNYSYRGIDNSSYYLLEADRSKYRNDAGCGNVLHMANRHVRKMMMDSLRFWVREMHVDGFRFDLASIFTRRSDGSINLADPPAIGEISSARSLEHVRLIAEAWDLASYQLGRDFPGITWLQWNGKFRDDLRKIVRGDGGLIGTLMTRLYGSDDLFPDQAELGYRPFQSVNYVCSHDGFNMRDLVSYTERRNWANGHNNTDGMSDNFSWNCGWEGDEGVPADVVGKRKQRVKNLFALLMLSNGTPMFCAGDEFFHTQGGNNNPYNQDNETTWLDWCRLEEHRDLFRFVQGMIAFRKDHPSLGRSTFWRESVRWYGTGKDVDMGSASKSLALCIHGAPVLDDDLYVIVNNCPESLDFTVQEGEARDWRRAVDTSLPSPSDVDVGVPVPSLIYRMAPHSVVVLVREGR